MNSRTTPKKRKPAIPTRNTLFVETKSICRILGLLMPLIASSFSHGQTAVNVVLGDANTVDRYTWPALSIQDATTGNPLYTNMTGGSKPANAYCFMENAPTPGGSVSEESFVSAMITAPIPYTAYNSVQTSMLYHKGNLSAVLTGADAAAANGMVAWLFDNYYDQYSLPSGDDIKAIDVFHNLIQEIGMDFDGSYASMVLSDGANSMSPAYVEPAALSILNQLKTDHSLSYYSTYSSSRFEFVFLQAPNTKIGPDPFYEAPDYQNLILVHEIVAVPETSSLILSSAGLLLLFRRRK